MLFAVQKLTNRLTFRQLQVFFAVYQQKNYSRAGALLGLTQPAVSSQIKQLETALDQTLFEYIGRRLYITAVGERLANSVEAIFSELRSLQTELVEMKEQVAGELKLAMVNTAQYVLPHILQDFITQYPSIDLRLQVIGWSDALQSMEHNEGDLFVMGMAPPAKSLTALPFLDNEHIAVASAKHPIHFSGSISIEQFIAHSLILREPGSGSRQILESFCQERHLTVEAFMQLESNDAIKQMTIAGLGVAVLPKLSMVNELCRGILKEIPLLDFPLRRSWCLVYPKNKSLSPAAQAFIDYVKKNLKMIEVVFNDKLKDTDPNLGM